MKRFRLVNFSHECLLVTVAPREYSYFGNYDDLNPELSNFKKFVAFFCFHFGGNSHSIFAFPGTLRARTVSVDSSSLMNFSYPPPPLVVWLHERFPTCSP